MRKERIKIEAVTQEILHQGTNGYVAIIEDTQVFINQTRRQLQMEDSPAFVYVDAETDEQVELLKIKSITEE